MSTFLTVHFSDAVRFCGSPLESASEIFVTQLLRPVFLERKSVHFLLARIALCVFAYPPRFLRVKLFEPNFCKGTFPEVSTFLTLPVQEESGHFSDCPLF